LERRFLYELLELVELFGRKLIDQLFGLFRQGAGKALASSTILLTPLISVGEGISVSCSINSDVGVVGAAVVLV
jgi:hypothetical protein